MSAASPKFVAIVGPAPGQPGGIASVMSYLQAELTSDDAVSISFLDTLRAGRWSMFRFLSALLQLLIFLVSRRGASVVHLNVSTRGSTYRKWCFSRICVLLRTPYVCHLHGSKYETFYQSSPAVIKWLTRSLFKGSHQTIVLGNHWRDFAVNALGLSTRQVVAIHNGTPEPEVTTSTDPEAQTGTRIAFSGRLSRAKGVYDLLQVGDLLHREVPNFSLLLMGECLDEKLLAEAKGRSYCTVTGWLTGQVVQKNLAQSTVFILPSYFEGLPMAMIEAMSLGLPVVVTPVGAISDVVTDGVEGFIRAPGDIDGLADALRKVIFDPVLRNKLGAAARTRWNDELRASKMTEKISDVWATAFKRYNENRSL